MKTTFPLILTLFLTGLSLSGCTSEAELVVLASTPILQPGETYELTFTVPAEPGKYRFICTIPGHWRSMQGTLIVEPAS